MASQRLEGDGSLSAHAAAPSLGILRGPIPYFVLLFIATVAIGVFFITRQLDAARSSTLSSLVAIVALKSDLVESWRDNRRGEATLILRNPMVTRPVARILAGAARPGDLDDVRSWMGIVRAVNGYRRVVLYDTAGRPLVSQPEGSGALEAGDSEGLAAALRGNDVVVEDMVFEGFPEVPIWIPIRADPMAEGEAIGALLVDTDPSVSLFPQLRSLPPESMSVEATLLRRDGNDVLIMSPLRYQADPTTPLRFSIADNPRLPSVQAVKGATGLIEGVDYRGIATFSAWQQVAGTGWIVSAKIDTAEVFGPLRARAGPIGGVFALTFLVVGLVIVLLWRRRDAAWNARQSAAASLHDVLAERFIHIVRFANDIILFLDKDWRIVEANERAISAYGYSMEELKGLTLGDLRSAAAREQFADIAGSPGLIDGVLAESEHRRRDGTVFPVETSVREARIGGATYYQAIIRDISERRRQEEDVRRQNAVLEARVAERTAELEAFSYSVSHDLRAPLRGIDGWSLALMEDYGQSLDATARDYLARVRSETQRMGMLIDDLLQLSRVTRTDMRRQHVDLSAIASRVAGRLQEANPDRVLELVVQPGVTAWADPSLMEVALTNLMDNAVKFTRRREAARVEFGCARDAGISVYHVRDNGVGFDPVRADRLFTPFQRLHRASEYPGTGIGLATVKRIVSRHGGRVWAEGAVDTGASFYFTIAEGS